MHLKPKDYSRTEDFLWTDLPDASAVIAAEQGTQQSKETLAHWVDQGYVILPSAVGQNEITAFTERLYATIEAQSPQLPISFWDAEGHHYGFANFDNIKKKEAKILDLHVRMEEAQALIFAKPITDFLTAVFRDEIVAFQCLYFHYGSQQGAHQDTAFVYTDPVYHFAASWIALEDIRSGTGELFYYPGSQRLDDLIFEKSGGKALLPGDPDSPEYSKRLENLAAAEDLPRQRLLAKASDALIWASDLIHGGEPLLRDRTRKSIVTHYCPRSAVVPYMRTGKGTLIKIAESVWVVGQY